MCRISSPKRGRKCRWKPGWYFLARGEYGKTRNENPYFDHIRSFVCCEGPAGLAVGAGLCPAQKPSAEVPATAARELPRENPPLVSNTPQRYSWYKGARSLSTGSFEEQQTDFLCENTGQDSHKSRLEA